MTVIVARYTDPLEAQLVCGRLQAEGIDAFVGDAHMALANWEWRLAIGGVKVHVPDAELARARAIVAELDAGAYTLSDQDTPMPAPVPVDRESWSSRLAWVALVVFQLPLPWRRRRR
ncbi:hypothetical protein BEN78_05705 [Xanthomonas citri pv. mangiferaeindicae]|uniref:putative signal transducing protein n=1 Tax=Luteimonas sp. gir TaxID=3127960 RepID=UPI000B8DA432|nr:hypothetical protein BEN78_05705 [Xanthomonas citri pv. mangiferaeindicae]